MAWSAYNNGTKRISNLPDTISLDVPVTASNCFACHGGLERTSFPGLNFDHNKHFAQGIRCQSCHQEFPHTPKGLAKPKMDVCFNCHGLNHGQQGQRATAKCDACHTGDFNLRPANHSPAWARSDHKNTNMKSANCSMCHKQDFCVNCHSKRSVNKVEFRIYKPDNAPMKSKGLKVATNGKVTASKCAPCHGNFNRERFPTLNFKHSVHFNRGVGCDKCHESFPHRRERQLKPYTEIPKMSLCFRCHGLSHGKQKTFATGDCSACHPVGFQLKPATHDRNWVKSPPFNHKKEAKADRSQCSMCHKQTFCNNCHGLEPIPHEKDWKDLHGTTVAGIARTIAKPSFDQLSCNNCHKPQQFCAKCHRGVVFPHAQDWPDKHGKTAKANGKDACYTCHRQQLCTGCHKGVQMPHANDWLGQHRKQDNISFDICLRCHVKGQCEQCHSSHKVHNRNKQYKFDFSGSIR